MTNSFAKYFSSSNVGFYLLIVATIGDLIIPFFLAPFCNKYNHLTMVMSLLGNRNTPLHIIYNIWLVAAGVMLILGTVKLYSTYNSSSKTLTSCLLLFFYTPLGHVFFLEFSLLVKQKSWQQFLKRYMVMVL